MADDERSSKTPNGDASAAKPRRRWRRALSLVIIILTVFLVYAYAFDKTDVSLDEFQSETRQDQLFRILRALAHPDLIHYDKDDLVIVAEVFVPCDGQEPQEATPTATGATIVVTPNCAETGDILVVTGTGFDPGQQVRVNYVPVSDFDVVLPQGRADVLDDGTFETSFAAPDRESDQAQHVEVITQTNVGSWRSRERVWTDTNGNAIQDPLTLPESDGDLSTYAFTLPEFDIRSPGGVTVVDENNNVLDFVSWGGSFEAKTGSGTGNVSRDIGVDPFTMGEDQSAQLIGNGAAAEDFTWSGPSPESFSNVNPGQTVTDSTDSLFFNEIAFAETDLIEIAAAPGTSTDEVTLIFFDAENGAQYKIVPLADEINLSPRLSDNALSTWDRIVETVMLALLATTIGTILAVPLSFTASKNLMRDVTVPVINLALSVVALPIGFVVGIFAARWARSLSGFSDANIVTLLLALAAISGAAFFLLRWTFPPEDEGNVSFGIKVLRTLALLATGFLMLIASFAVADLLVIVGGWFESLLPFATFMGSFVVTLGELTEIGVPVFSALIGAFAMALAASKLGYFLDGRVSRQVLNGLTLGLSALAGAMAGMGIGAVVEWFYQLENPVATVIVPATVGGLIGIRLSIKAIRRAESQNIGLTVYYLARTMFNGTRSIEPLVMVIIFVVWVGIGPFAGALALALHTTASLAKLYSEQVESINTGPLEAVRATGATRVQTIIFGVVPQIIPPYISFTMYRWDINVRMSTIIGFAGGGGIGFLLQQNINLLQYRAAAAQMLAIAIVVVSMDYVSSRLRERYV